MPEQTWYSPDRQWRATLNAWHVNWFLRKSAGAEIYVQRRYRINLGIWSFDRWGSAAVDVSLTVHYRLERMKVEKAEVIDHEGGLARVELSKGSWGIATLSYSDGQVSIRPKLAPESYGPGYEIVSVSAEGTAWIPDHPRVELGPIETAPP